MLDIQYLLQVQLLLYLRVLLFPPLLQLLLSHLVEKNKACSIIVKQTNILSYLL